MLRKFRTRAKSTTPFVPRIAAQFAVLLAVLSGTVLSGTIALGQSPRVEFDVACLTPVTDVGEVAEEATHSPYRDVEARLPISILLAAGNQNQLSEVVIRIESRHRNAEVIDFAPRTRLASSVVGNVEVTERGEEHKHADINLFGVAPAAPTIHGKASAGYRDDHEAVWSYERLPPHEVLVASGTTDRGYGAFFKFRPSSQASLEGSHDLLLKLRVPKNWRSEIYDVTAIAYARRGKEISFDDRPIAGQKSFTLVFYQAGDEQIRKHATLMATNEETFKAVVWRDRKAIERMAFPSPFDKVGSVIGVVGPRIPANWYRDLLEPSTVNLEQVPRNLPSEVRTSANAMVTSRKDYENARRSPMETSKRRQTIFSNKMASGSPQLSAKKPDSPWKRRETGPGIETKPINR